MSGPPTARLVIGRELRESFRRKTIWLAAAVLLVGGIGLVVVPELVGDSSDDRAVVLVGTPGEFARLQGVIAEISAALDLDVTVVSASSDESARLAVEEGDVDAAVVLARTPPMVIADNVDAEIVTIVRQAITVAAFDASLSDAGLTPSEIASVFDAGDSVVEELDPVDDARRNVAAVVAIVLYLLLVLLTSAVANGVAIEKSNRVSEVLLAIVPARHLLFGKVIGVALVGVFTLTCGALPVVIKAIVGGSLPDGIGATLVAGGIWFVLGIALYLTTAGALGALVDRQEEVGSTIAPLSAILIIAYLVGLSAPESGLATLLAFIPFTAPMVMPTRVALGVASTTELVVSFAIGVVTVVVVARLAATVYERAIVRTGTKLRLRTVLRRS